MGFVPLRPHLTGAICVALAVGTATFAGSAHAAPKPDLKLTAISTASTEAMAGSEFAAKNTLRNTGAAAAGKSTTRFYLSKNDSKGGGDVRLQGSRLVGPLAKGGTSSDQTPLRVPLAAPQGDVFLIGCADDHRKVEEKRENNNCRTAGSTIRITLPVLCRDRLTALGIEYASGPSKPGVDDPVTVKTPINGINYSSAIGGNDAKMYMDCTLALAMHEMAGELAARGVKRVVHAGIYNYRCIGAVGTPPDCPNGISQHAYATALDIVELRSGGGQTYNVNDDWLIDPDPEDTCGAPTSGAKDTLLHEFVCSLYAAGTFQIVLTPNYNADHRDHFHLDLTPNVSFIE